jgi:hypothetical protein
VRRTDSTTPPGPPSSSASSTTVRGRLRRQRNAIRSHVAPFAPEASATLLERDQPEVQFLDYDWMLNAQRPK